MAHDQKISPIFLGKRSSFQPDFRQNVHKVDTEIPVNLPLSCAKCTQRLLKSDWELRTFFSENETKRFAEIEAICPHCRTEYLFEIRGDRFQLTQTAAISRF